jgi:hypothetical protein
MMLLLGANIEGVLAPGVTEIEFTIAADKALVATFDDLIPGLQHNNSTLIKHIVVKMERPFVRLAIRATTIIDFFAFDAATLILALRAREAILAVKAKCLFTHFTEERIFAVVAEWLVALVTDEHILAVETMYTFA